MLRLLSSRALVCATFPFLLFGLALAAEGESGPARSGVVGNQGPGEDVEGGPITTGEQFRRWTDITPAEIHAADPNFRHWVELIRSGQADKRIMRLYWYFRSRLEPFDKPLPSNWREEGLRVLDARAKSAAATKARGDDAPGGIPASGVWVPVGPFDIAGRTRGIAQPAGQPNTLYAATADGGVWRTLDAGQSWQPLSDFEATLAGGAIVLDPTNPNVLYFGTGETRNIDGYSGVGVLKSVDAGQTWSSSNAFSPFVMRLAIHESLPGRIFAAGQNGCYVSTDAGATFSAITAANLPTGVDASDVVVRPDDPDVVYCAYWGAGIFRSIDGGASWTSLSNGLPTTSTGRIALAVSRSNADVLLAGLGTGGGHVYTTTDGGDSWTHANGGNPLNYCGSQCWYDNAVGIDPVDPNLMYAGGVNLYRSTDGGAGWSTVGSGVHVDHHFILTPRAGEVFTANDGGIYYSSQSGANGTFVEWSIGMDTTQYYGICRHATDDYWVFGGTQDNGSHRRRQLDGWQEVLGADGGMCMAGPPGSDVVIGEQQNHAMRRSADGGATWSNAENGIEQGDPRAWVGVMEVDPTDRNHMWTVTNDVYRSLDAKATAWVKVGPTLHCGGGLTGCLSATAIAIAPSDSNTVYVGFGASAPVPPVADGKRAGVYRATNALASPVTWSDVSKPDWPYRSIRAVTVHPDDANTVYAVLAGFGAGKIWKTGDGGTSWVDRTGNHPDIPINDLLVDADDPGTLLTATDLGVYRSDDDGATWYGFSNSLPRAAAIEFAYSRATGTLRVGTHGRSVWEFQPASGGGVVSAVPDGANVPGSPMRASRIDAATLRVEWDVVTCTASAYNLFFGDLENVASLTYDGAECGLGNTGTADVPMPATSSGDAFFIVASTDGQGTEGAHGYASGGTPRTANGIGLCGLSSQNPAAGCP